MDELLENTGGSTLGGKSLPVFVDVTVERYLALLNPRAPKDYLRMCVMACAGHVASWQRVVAARRCGDEAPANFYGVAFMPSGFYKDKPFNDMRKDIISFIDDDMAISEENMMRSEMARLYEDGDMKYGKGDKGGHRQQTHSFVKENMPRGLVNFFRSGTTAPGLVSLRRSFKTAGKGSPFLLISEFSNLLQASSGNDQVMLNLVEELFDKGDNDEVVLKGTTTLSAVKGVPQTAWFHSSFFGMLEDKPAWGLLLKSLNRQMARRSHFLFAEERLSKVDESVTDAEIDEHDRMEGEAMANAPMVRRMWADAFDALRTDKSGSGNARLVFSDEANRAYIRYKLLCDKRADNIRGELAPEMRGRHFKAMKDAGVIAAFENPNRGVTLDNVRQAIGIVEFSGMQFSMLALKKSGVFSDGVVEFLSSRGGAGAMTTEIKSLGLCNDNYFSRALDDNMRFIMEICDLTGRVYYSAKEGRNGVRHFIVPKPGKWDEVERFLGDGEVIMADLSVRYGEGVVKKCRDLYLKMNP